MPEALSAVFAIEGVVWLLAIALVAGTVRGFAGFGGGMIYMPVAAQILPPVAAIATLMLMELIGQLPMIPRAIAHVHVRDLRRLMISTLMTLPIGMALLFAIAPEVFRYALSIISLGMLVILLSGLRYRGEVRPPMVYGVGAMCGITGGSVGIPGPPIILFYMSRPLPPQVIRANTALYMVFFDLLMIAGFAVLAKFDSTILLLGLCLNIPNFLGNMLGTWLFNPAYTRIYRTIAYVIIAAAAISGLPFLNASGH